MPQPTDVETFIAEVVDAHEALPSWRLRLDWIQGRLQDPARPPTEDELAVLAVYLRFLASGQVACGEDGRHFRPNHHARAAQAIDAALRERVAPESTWLVRMIAPWLPNHGPEFLRGEPLTRIRDIAHRNDIPKPLKKEIKHALQNKLHRCAGPEDLRTSMALLGRITAPGADLSPEFVEEFRRFHRELEAFFNAPGLEYRLQQLAMDLPTAGRDRALSILKVKRDGDWDDAALEWLLRTVTALRADVAKAGQGADGSLRQRLLLTDIALEEFSFTLFSQVVNRWSGGSEALQRYLALVLYGIRQVRMSGVEKDECEMLERQRVSWPAGLGLSDEVQLHRVRAWLARAQRMTESHAQRILDLLTPPAERLGRRLGVEARALRVFGEAQVRGNLVFQLSRLLEVLLDAVHERLGLSPWTVVVAGEGAGVLRLVSRLEDVSTGDEAVVAQMERVEGDEDLPPSTRGLVLGQPIPLLSHLAIRMRQAGVPCVAARAPGAPAAFGDLVGRWVRMWAGDPDLRILPMDEGDMRTRRSAVTGSLPPMPAVSLEQAGKAISLAEVTEEAGGAKAHALGRLMRLAREPESGFQVPDGWVLPFGSLEAGLAACGHDRVGRYRALVENLDRVPDDALDAPLAEICELCRTCPVPEGFSEVLADRLGNETLFAVRSSGSSEDLVRVASAGLYQSVIGVPRGRVPDAIRSVWASLWSPLAVLNRRRGGLTGGQAHMAVIVQPLQDAEYAFILHSAEPPGQVQIELAAGLGETLASAWQPGSPWRMRVNRERGDVALESVADYSYALRRVGGQVVRQRMDYSQEPLYREPQGLWDIARRLGAVAGRVERAFGAAQNVEGVLMNGEIHLVQTRPQQGSISGSHGTTAGSGTGRTPTMAQPGLLAMQTLQEPIQGDDALLRLAQIRLHGHGLGGEFYPGDERHLADLLDFRPEGHACVAHLPRDIDLLRSEGRERLMRFVVEGTGRLRGVLVHDRVDLPSDRGATRRAFEDLQRSLDATPGRSLVFVEYAAGLRPGVFAQIFEDNRDLAGICPAVDVGHVGIQVCRDAYARSHPGDDVCDFPPDSPDTAPYMDAIQVAVAQALPEVLSLIRRLGGLQKPLHFHLHDGHPLSNLSLFGVSDHLSFLQSIPLAFSYRGRETVQGMYGPAGLRAIIGAAMEAAEPERLSFTLEMHPQGGRSPLGVHAPLFGHWRDMNHAEMMNAWLDLLLANATLVRDGIALVQETR